jgi:hypothetical protein
MWDPKLTEKKDPDPDPKKSFQIHKTVILTIVSFKFSLNDRNNGNSSKTCVCGRTMTFFV